MGRTYGDGYGVRIMSELTLRGDEIEYIVTKTEAIEEWNSMRWFWNGHEVHANDLELVIYNDTEQD